MNVFICLFYSYELAVSYPRVLQFLLLSEASSLKALLVTHVNNLHLNLESDLQQWWQTMACNAHSLKHICRLAIRRVLIQLACGQGILSAIEQLPLPRVVRDFLSYKQEVIDWKLQISSDCDTSDEEDQVL